MSFPKLKKKNYSFFSKTCFISCNTLNLKDYYYYTNLLSQQKMALGKKRIVAQRLELEFVEYKRGFGRKRVLISSSDEIFASPKKLCDRSQSLELEDLPHDILVKIICGVEHEDLKQLFQVSKTMKEATLVAKESHFAYNTPRKTSVFHHGGFGLGKPCDVDDDIEAPGAPLQKRFRSSRINREKEDFTGVSVALFN